MKYLPLVLANLMRKKFRTLFTLLSIFIAFILFGLLGAIETAFDAGIDLAGNDRLVMRHKVSLIQPLPIAYQGRIAQTEGVDAVTHSSWFGGIYQDPKNFFAQIAVEPEEFLDLYPEIHVPDDQAKAWEATRTGVVVGKDLAKRFDWKVGDRIPIQGTIYRRADGSDTWEFDVVGIYDAAPGKKADLTAFYFQYDYLKEGGFGDTGLIGWYVIRVKDPERSAEIAAVLDDQFANSPYETKTATEKAFIQAFAKQVGNTTAIIRAVLVAVFFTMLLVAANTMARAVRERTNELAVLKAMGFGKRQILGMVLAESFLLSVIGGTLGLAVAGILVLIMGEALQQYLPVVYLPAAKVVWGCFFFVLLGLVAGVWPAYQAMRLRVADALRRV